VHLTITPQDIKNLKRANLWIRLGCGVESPYEKSVLETCNNTNLLPGSKGYLDASVGVMLLDNSTPPLPAQPGDKAVNPYYLLDLANGRIVARNIAARLTELLPGDAELIQGNLAHFLRETDMFAFGYGLVEKHGADKLWDLLLTGQLEAFIAKQELHHYDGWCLDRLAKLRGKKIVAYSPCWAYFAHRWGLEVVAYIQPDPERPPAEQHLADVIARAKQDQVPLILVEPYADRQIAERVAQQASAKTLVCPSAVGGDPMASGYCRTTEYLVNSMVSALRKE
jgi:ABC-type Zn uptake system ZnuABC Zn-binding protein ZnuA